MDVLIRHQIILISLITTPVLASCQMTYLVKSAYSQADLLRRRVPIEEALRDTALTSEQKRKLELARDARVFAEEHLGLAKTKNYTSFVQLDRPFVTYVVNAAPKNELKPHLWKYPLVGELPYKGFFDPEGAQKEAETLKHEGLDVHVRGVSAYSTLGWFRDPILSSMLAYDDHDLVNTIIHETVHATIYIQSEAEFNERLATFIGNKGTEAFYRLKEGAQSSSLKRIADDAQAEKIFGHFISNELTSLEKWYTERRGRVITEEERQRRIAEIGHRFTTSIRPLIGQDSYRTFEKTNINNASLLNYRLYFKDLSEFESVFHHLGGDFKKMLGFCRALEKSENPQADLSAAAKQAALNSDKSP